MAKGSNEIRAKADDIASIAPNGLSLYLPLELKTCFGSEFADIVPRDLNLGIDV